MSRKEPQGPAGERQGRKRSDPGSRPRQLGVATSVGKGEPANSRHAFTKFKPLERHCNWSAGQAAELPRCWFSMRHTQMERSWKTLSQNSIEVPSFNRHSNKQHRPDRHHTHPSSHTHAPRQRRQPKQAQQKRDPPVTRLQRPECRHDKPKVREQLSIQRTPRALPEVLVGCHLKLCGSAMAS